MIVHTEWLARRPICQNFNGKWICKAVRATIDVCWSLSLAHLIYIYWYSAFIWHTLNRVFCLLSFPLFFFMANTKQLTLNHIIWLS